jgi:hypothetical protein
VSNESVIVCAVRTPAARSTLKVASKSEFALVHRILRGARVGRQGGVGWMVGGRVRKEPDTGQDSPPQIDCERVHLCMLVATTLRTSWAVQLLLLLLLIFVRHSLRISIAACGTITAHGGSTGIQKKTTCSWWLVIISGTTRIPRLTVTSVD